MKTAAVIGAGIAGIAASIRLAVKGYSVDVFEANAYAGGKLSTFSQATPTGEVYRFDAGPSLFTMPHLVDELFQLAGRDPSDYFEYDRLDETCRYFWDDGTRLTAWADQDRFGRDVEAVLGEPAEHLHQHLADSAVKYEVTEKLFLHRSLHKLATWLNRDALRGYLNLPKLGVFSTMNSANERRFRHPKLVQLFNRYATYNGSDPYQTPATLNIIPHLEYNIGAFFPKQGMVSITNSLVRLAENLGVRFHYNSRITEIVTEKERVMGLMIGQVRHPFDLIVSNMDVVSTFRKLLPNARQPERILKQPKSSSGLIFYWGIRREFSELALHNIFFSTDYRAEFDALFGQQQLSDDPTIYLNITSKHKPDDAPAGCENWFILLNAPNNTGQDWDAVIDRARTNVIRKLSHALGVEVGALIETESVLDPRSIEVRTSSSQGALYGNSSNNRFAAFMRHANFSHEFKNLYFVGGSVHPGGGIPLCLLSAKIATELIG
ncbi:1-hydroxycarotenoid 3,4-desaturase CrtD [Spirosoma utsteinense]|uniref:Phytoene desaturase n=1 Tax=Spirosoma utsteinense TaxID=2585773 RepID=A0ABR6W0A8_9BACT|nr:1-hydroxycarotenoid 3,4-desaturase CrtD [Spirosoma utsteinense]MBC3788139.1 phytoene desaturase [Spirosoma utsteinense]MBC3789999.1 phytoene desaturase [Spirosoma utsteinense]